jgi:hypothetical protein
VKSSAPILYGDVRTTNLTAVVKEQSNTLDLKLSDAEAPNALEPAATAKGATRKGR